MDEQLMLEIQRGSRYGRNLSVMMCDIDHFKRINDTWGHQAGDRVLSEVGSVLQAGIRQGVDWGARYGGEEFLVVMPEISLASSVRLAESLKSNLENLHIRVEDPLLYKAKQSGRNRIIIQ